MSTPQSRFNPEFPEPLSMFWSKAFSNSKRVDVTSSSGTVLPQMRKFFFDLLSVWNSMQQTGDAQDMGQALMRHSRLYRACFGAHLEEIGSKLRERRDPFITDDHHNLDDVWKEYERQKGRLAEYHVIWYLCEILFLSSAPEQSVTAQLLDWMHLTFYPDVSLIQKLESKEIEYDDSVDRDMWTLCTSFTVQACFKEAAICLDILAKKSKNALEAKYLQVIGALVVETPLLSVAMSLREFMPRFQMWHQKCVQLLQATQRDKCINASKLLSILTGDEKALVGACNWVELLIAHLVFVDPSHRRHHIRELAHRTLELKSQRVEELAPYMRILHAVFTDDLVLALKVSSKFTQPWFSAHLIDLLFHDVDLLPPGSANTREAFVLAHVDDLRDAPDMWPVALQYLHHLGTPHAKALMSEILSQVVPTTDRAATDLHSSALRFSLTETASHIAHAWAIVKWRQGSIQDAFDWARLAFITSPEVLPRMVFALADSSRGLNDLEATLQSFVLPTTLASGQEHSALRFVEALSQLARARSSGDLPKAAQLLCRLICDRLSPQRFWIGLLEQCLSLFEESVSLFSSSDIRMLLHRLQTVLASGVTPKTQDEELKMQALQMAMTRCAARSFCV